MGSALTQPSHRSSVSTSPVSTCPPHLMSQIPDPSSPSPPNHSALFASLFSTLPDSALLCLALRCGVLLLLPHLISLSTASMPLRTHYAGSPASPSVTQLSKQAWNPRTPFPRRSIPGRPKSKFTCRSHRLRIIVYTAGTHQYLIAAKPNSLCPA